MSMYTVQEVIANMDKENPLLLQVLLAVQDANPLNYVSVAEMSEIATILGVTKSRVFSTASFYSEISLTPRGRHLIRVCTNAPCENAGKEELVKAIEKELNISIGQTTADQYFTLESVNCLGACFMAPAIKIDKQIYGDLTPDKAVQIIRKMRGANNDECGK